MKLMKVILLVGLVLTNFAFAEGTHQDKLGRKIIQKCESRGVEYAQCNVSGKIKKMKLKTRLSDPGVAGGACNPGSWGFHPYATSFYVTNGCAAEFELEIQ